MTSAIARVLDLYELLEQILFESNSSDILVFQRVSQHWKYVITTSGPLQRWTWLQDPLATEDSRKKVVPENISQPRLGKMYLFNPAINDLGFRRPDIEHEGGPSFDTALRPPDAIGSSRDYVLQEVLPLYDLPGSWVGMQLTAPPTRYVRIDLLPCLKIDVEATSGCMTIGDLLAALAVVRKSFTCLPGGHNTKDICFYPIHRELGRPGKRALRHLERLNSEWPREEIGVKLIQRNGIPVGIIGRHDISRDIMNACHEQDLPYWTTRSAYLFEYDDYVSEYDENNISSWDKRPAELFRIPMDNDGSAKHADLGACKDFCKLPMEKEQLEEFDRVAEALEKKGARVLA
ncbi:MAG: hypothetical protein M1820_008213 [Bogoriella megaspora]|nr:MAG: hypothetical protein M1820_008213 [Bogoriella megaspora]